MPGNFYVVATPIGNLEDISLRALKVLRNVDLILAEDTRETTKLLNHYDIKVPTLSYFQHSGDKRRFEVLNYLMEGKEIALVCDAGTPGISDPGNELINFLLSFNPEIKIIPIPGASAITTALSVCGFNTNRFLFLGFLPKKKLTKLFDWIKKGKITFCFYESPRRILKTLETLEKFFGSNTRVFVGRELTKIHESYYRGTISEVTKNLSSKNIKGEIVVVVSI